MAHILKTQKENVKTFNVELKHKFPPQIDVRFFVKEDSQYFKPVRLEGVLQIHRQQVIFSISLTLSELVEIVIRQKIEDHPQ